MLDYSTIINYKTSMRCFLQNEKLNKQQIQAFYDLLIRLFHESLPFITIEKAKKNQEKKAITNRQYRIGENKIRDFI